MGKEKISKLLVVLLLVAVFGIGAHLLVPDEVRAETRLSLATSPPGGSWYPMAAALAELFNKEIKGLTVTVDGTGGGSTNPKLLAAKKVEIALSTLDMVFASRKGTKPYKKKYDLSGVGSIILQHSSPGHIVVREDSDIKNISDLKGKTMAIGERGAAGNTRAMWYLEVAGLSPEDVKLEYIGDDQASGALADRRIDAMIEFVGVPAPAVLNLATTTDIRLINLTAEQQVKLKEKWPFMVPTKIPAGTYKSQSNDYVGFGVTGCLMVLNSVPEDVVYQMCNAIDRNWEHLYRVHKGFKLWKFAPDIAQVSGQPLHPGAEKFYKEKGLLK
jgi:TRAP transporter TAXI family solute receptor